MNYKIIYVLLITVFIFTGCKDKPSEQGQQSISEENVKTDLDVKPSAYQLIMMARNASENIVADLGMREHVFNKAIGYYKQVIALYPSSYEAVESQFYIGKLTEEKIKYYNYKEINYRQRLNIGDSDFSFEDDLLPYLRSYTPAINEYLKLHQNRSIYKLRSSDRERAYKYIVDGLIRAAKLLADETNPDRNMNKAAEIYKIILDEYKETGYIDLVLYNIINIYNDLKNWEQVVKYGNLMEQLCMQSSFYLDVSDKVQRAKHLLNMSESK